MVSYSLKKSRALFAAVAIGLASIGYTTISHAVIVNINSVTNSTGSPVEIFLEAGSYKIEPIGVSNGGAFDAWQPWGEMSTNCTEPDGCLPESPYNIKGWVHTYSVQSSNISAVNVNGVDLVSVNTPPPLPSAVFETFFLDSLGDVRFNVGSEFLYPSADLALSAALTSHFTVDAAGMVGFAILDSPYGDNAGGVSLNISAIPIPAAVWLFGSGLIGLICISRRKKA